MAEPFSSTQIGHLFTTNLYVFVDAIRAVSMRLAGGDQLQTNDADDDAGQEDDL